MPLLRLFSATAVAFVLALAGSACGKDEPTPTAPTTTTTPAAAPTVTEEFNGTVPVGGSAFYSFTVSQFGTVNITLTSVSGQVVPSTVTMGLGIGVPDGTDCATTTSVNTRSSSSVQVTGTYNPGVYCAKVFDVGNLFGPARISVTIAYP